MELQNSQNLWFVPQTYVMFMFSIVQRGAALMPPMQIAHVFLFLKSLGFLAQIHWVISSVSTAPSGIMRHPKAERGCRHSAAYPPCGHCDRRAMLWSAMLIYVDRPQEQGGIRCSVAAGCIRQKERQPSLLTFHGTPWLEMWDICWKNTHTHTHRVPKSTS